MTLNNREMKTDSMNCISSLFLRFPPVLNYYPVHRGQPKEVEEKKENHSISGNSQSYQLLRNKSISFTSSTTRFSYFLSPERKRLAMTLKS